MKNIVKVGILLVVLAIPTFIFLFLHGFGSNEFEVPLLYEDGVDTLGFNCVWDTPHRVSDPRALFTSQLTLVGLIHDPVSKNQVLDYLKRLDTDFEDYKEFSTVAIFDTTQVPFPADEFQACNIYPFQTNSEQFDNLVHCGFVVKYEEPEDDPLILVDAEKRVRGYYYLNRDKEFERLISEVYIMLDNQKQR